jgi:co-chaperonin GroES (HSP10)
MEGLAMELAKVADTTLPVQPRRLLQVPTMPALLKARLEFFKITPPNFAPVFDRIFVAPLEDKEMEETAGGIKLAAVTKAKLSSQRGLLMGAGAKAVEELYAHGISLGHIVVCVRFSPHERSYMTGGHMHSMLLLRSSEVIGSEDLQIAYDKGDAYLEMASDGEVAFCTRDEGSRARVDPPPNIEVF